MKVVARAIMSVYDGNGHRTFGDTDPFCANIVNNNDAGLVIVSRILERLQRNGVKPGKKLRITVETL